MIPADRQKTQGVQYLFPLMLDHVMSFFLRLGALAEFMARRRACGTQEHAQSRCILACRRLQKAAKCIFMTCACCSSSKIDIAAHTFNGQDGYSNRACRSHTPASCFRPMQAHLKQQQKVHAIDHSLGMLSWHLQHWRHCRLLLLRLRQLQHYCLHMHGPCLAVSMYEGQCTIAAACSPLCAMSMGQCTAAQLSSMCCLYMQLAYEQPTSRQTREGQHPRRSHSHHRDLGDSQSDPCSALQPP